MLIMVDFRALYTFARMLSVVSALGGSPYDGDLNSDFR